MNGKKNFETIIDYEKLIASSNNKTIEIPGKVIEPLGSKYYLRNKDIKIKD